MNASGKHYPGPGLFGSDFDDLSDLNQGLPAIAAGPGALPSPIIDVPLPAAPGGSPAVAATPAPSFGTARPSTEAGAPIPISASALTPTPGNDESVPVSNGNFAINLEFDADAMAAPSSFRTEMEQAASLLAAAISVPKPVTVNLQIEYNEDGIADGSADAGPSTGLFEPYSAVRAALIADAPGDANFKSLPAGTTFQGQSEVAVWNAQLKVFGLLAGNASAIDGVANFSNDIASDALVGVGLHELSHALGRVPYGPPDSSSPDIFDLYRFTSPGTVLIQDTIPATATYFSVNGGASNLADYGLDSDPSDFLNSSAPNDPLDEYYIPGSTFQTLTALDLTQLDVLGFSTTGGLVTPRVFDWTAASNSNFANALNWDDVTDGLDPASTPPGATDLASISVGGLISGTGTVHQLNFASINTLAGTVTVGASLDGTGGSLTVTGSLTMNDATLDGTLSAKSGGRINAGQSIVLASGALSADGASSVEVGTAGGAAAGLMTVDAGGEINGDGTLAGAVLNNGSITASVGNADNILEITGAITGSGTIAQELSPPGDVGAIVQLDSSVAASQSIDFGDSYYDAGGTPTLRLLDPTQFAGALDDFWGRGDSLVLPGETVTNAVINNSTMTVSLSVGGPLTFNLTGAEASTSELYFKGSTVAILPLRDFVWTAAVNSNFATAANWNDETDALDPAATPPGVTDEAEFYSAGAISGGGAVYALLFSGAANTVTGALTAADSMEEDTASLTVTGSLAAEYLDLFSSSLQASAGGGVKASVNADLSPAFGTTSKLSVDSGSSMEIGTAGGAAVGAITTDTGFGIYGDGTLAAPVINNGFLYAYDEPAGLNVLEITGALTGTGYVYLDYGYVNGGTVVPGAVVQLDGSAASSQTFDYLNSSTLGVEPDLRLLDPSAFKGALDAFDSAGDALELVGQTVTGASVTGSKLTVTVQGGGPFLFNLLSTPSDTILEWSGDEVSVAGVARTMEWTGSTDSSGFGDPDNWYDATDNLNPATSAPASVDTVEFIGGGSPITGTGTMAALSFSGSGAWNLTSGALLNASGSVVFGATQPAVVEIDAASGIVAGAGAVIASTSGASGSAVDLSGAGSYLTVIGTIVVGDAGSGALSLSQGASVTVGALDLGAVSTGDGDVSLAGAGTTLDVTGALTLGGAAAGELSILGGARMTAGGGVVGSSDSAPGNLDVEGSGSQLTINTGTLTVGANGPAEFTLGIGATLQGEVANGQFGVVNEYGNVDPPTDPNDGTQNVGFGNSLIYDFYVANSGTIKITSGTATFYTPLATDETNAADGSTNGLWVIGAHDTLVMNATSVDNTQTFDFTSPSAASLVIGQVPRASTTEFDTFDGQTLPSLTGSIAPGSPNVLPGWNAPIENYQSGDVIVLQGLTYRSATASGAVLTVWSGTGGTGNPLGSLTFVTKSGAPSSTDAAAAANQINSLACFAAGTRIETANGWVTVEELRVGDRVRTVRDSVVTEQERTARETAAATHARCEPIVWLGSRVVDCARHPWPETVWPIRIAAGAFGDHIPVRELYLSPDHAVFINGVLIPVKLLINGTSITRVKRDQVSYHHIEFADHAVILAEGLPVESYLDTGDRTNFEAGGTIRLFPDFTARLRPDAALSWEAKGAAPLVVTGPRLAAARRMVAEATNVSGHLAGTAPRRRDRSAG